MVRQLAHNRKCTIIYYIFFIFVLLFILSKLSYNTMTIQFTLFHYRLIDNDSVHIFSQVMTACHLLFKYLLHVVTSVKNRANHEQITSKIFIEKMQIKF